MKLQLTVLEILLVNYVEGEKNKIMSKIEHFL